MTSTTLPLSKPALTLQDRVACCAAEGAEAINDRLNTLEAEWTAGRMAKATLGVVIFAGFALATLHDPLWMILPAVAGALLLQYVFWRGGLLTEFFCKLGFRSSTAIDEERYALRTLRGDFRNLPTVYEVEDPQSVCRFEDEGGPAVERDERLFAPQEAATLILAATK